MERRSIDITKKAAFTGTLKWKGCGKMAKKALVNNKKYVGKFVAMVSFNDRSVIASGANPTNVIKRAEKKGFSRPVVIHVPEEKMFNVY